MKSDIKSKYEKLIKRNYIILLVFIALIFLLGIYFMTLGVADTNMINVTKAIWLWIKGDLSGNTEKIIVLMRLPRIVMAIVAGVGMAISGTAMQSVTRNPLVSPFTMGVSSAAAFGASMCIVFATNMFFKSEVGVILCAFISAITCIILVYAVSSKIGMTPEAVVLTGIALNYLFSALTSTVEFFAQEHKLAAVVRWAFGTFNGITWSEVLVSASFVICCSIPIFINSLKLNVMASGDDELSESLGINPKKIRIIVGLSSVLMTSAIISFTGVIGFVGLVAPHISRLLIGNDHRFLLPASAITGSILLMCSDAIGKTILSPVSIPVGIVVSFLGVPLFINLILNDKRRSA